jgi:hypothetical protein
MSRLQTLLSNSTFAATSRLEFQTVSMKEFLVPVSNHSLNGVIYAVNFLEGKLVEGKHIALGL